MDSLTVIEPEAYALLRMQNPDAYTQICGLRDRWRAHVRRGSPTPNRSPAPSLPGSSTQHRVDMNRVRTITAAPEFRGVVRPIEPEYRELAPARFVD
ncbi:MAG: hypothetical protein JO181_15010 [Solirubrobacterales bacterium]|nr:hypothetical protein [Solirubrobacterales bacterium]